MFSNSSSFPSCTSGDYAIGHVALCEVGDISGKFGSLLPSSSSSLMFSGSASNDPNPPLPRYYQASDRISLPWASVVFHCPVAGNPRILCAQLIPTDSTNDDDSINSNSVGNDDYERIRWEATGIAFILFTLFLLSGGVVWCVYFRPRSSAPDPAAKLNDVPGSHL